jgi:hypothetical protein
MYFTAAITVLCSISAVTAAVLPRQMNTTAISNTTTSANTTLPPLSLNSDNFIIRARQLNDSSVTLGYLYAEYAYPPGYYATLRPKEEAIVGHLTDTTNPSNSSLVFGEEYPQGFVLSPLSSYQNASIAMIYSGQQGTKGVFVNEGGIVDWASQRVSWYGEFIACFVSRRSRCADNVEQLATRH